ncbi:sulfite exporter TauE/SafE family protein [Paenibacillus sp. IB182496]|uniref:Probable membrane transporter protein n=1 Tax=Paenibacillus sabuli TaxID=2772509 RepID=A0A927BWV5_9BACL|nr:sulfite exporter TauE/SafE family protein [Paenibacillus sabuli]MBD2848353.1 sulfite exporter TauE/SafE family protein [Paenibacillus sabuli]
MLDILILILLGFAGAAFGSIVGLGGGIILVPGLLWLGPQLTGAELGHEVAVGVSLAVLIVTALASTTTYAKAGRVDFRSGWLLFVASGPAAMLGAAMTGLMGGAGFQLMFGVFILLMAWLLIARDRLKPAARRWPIMRSHTEADGTQRQYGYALAPLLAIGFGVGLISGLFGIGGGSLFVPAMVLLFRFPPHIAAATSMFVIFLSSITGSAVHGWLGEIDYRLALALAPGAWLGGKAGAYIAGRMSGNGLLWLLRATLVVMAIRLIWSGVAEL